MPIIIALLGAAAAVAFFLIRARNAAHVATELIDVANDVRLAARRFGFRRKSNVHPVESIDDSNLAILAIATSFLELDNLPTQQQRDSLLVQGQAQLGLSEKDVSEMMVLGRWLMNECGGPAPAVTRMSRKLYKLAGAEAFDPLLAVVRATLGEKGLTQAHREALDEIRRAFRIK